MPDKADLFRYQNVANSLLEQIRVRQIQPGDRLPSERYWAELFQVGRPTLNKAIIGLISQGHLRREGYKLYLSAPTAEESGAIAVLCPHPLHQKKVIVHHNLVEAAHDVCQQARVRFSPMFSLDGPQQRTQLQQLLRESPAGIVIWPHPEEPLADLLRQFVGRGVPVLVNDLNLGEFDYVGVDNLQGMIAIVRHLHELGHREVAYFSRPLTNGNLIERRDGFQYAAQHSFGERSVGRVFELRSEDSAREVILRLCREKNHVTAICCSNDSLALEILRLCQAEGISVPGALSLVGFDGIEASEASQPTLSTVAQDFYQMGTLAVELLLRRIRARNLQHDSHALKIRMAPRLLIRSSSGPVPA